MLKYFKNNIKILIFIYSEDKNEAHWHTAKRTWSNYKRLSGGKAGQHSDLNCVTDSYRPHKLHMTECYISFYVTVSWFIRTCFCKHFWRSAGWKASKWNRTFKRQDAQPELQLPLSKKQVGDWQKTTNAHRYTWLHTSRVSVKPPLFGWEREVLACRLFGLSSSIQARLPFCDEQYKDKTHKRCESFCALGWSFSLQALNEVSRDALKKFTGLRDSGHKWKSSEMKTWEDEWIKK